MSRAFNIYLSGPCKNTDDDGKTWQNEFDQMTIENTLIRLFCPSRHFDYGLMKPQTDKECKALFLNRLKKSDLCVVNLENTESSVGTGFEIGYCAAMGIPVIGFNNNHSYNWIVEQCDVVLDSMEDVYLYIFNHYIVEY